MLNWQCRLMADAELTVQADGRHWTYSAGWWQTLNWQYRLMADAELTVQADCRHWTDSTDWWQTLNWQCRLMADVELTVQADGRRWTDSTDCMADAELTVQTVWQKLNWQYRLYGRHWTDSTDWWQTLNWQYRLYGRRWTDSTDCMADTELTVHTVWFSFGSYYTHDYFLISYFHRIPFGFIFPLSVVWCSFVNFLSQFAITCVLCCVVFNLCMCTVCEWGFGLPFAAYRSGEEWNTVCWICVSFGDGTSDAGYCICYMLVAVMCVQPAISTSGMLKWQWTQYCFTSHVNIYYR